jgi:hypothetical protein
MGFKEGNQLTIEGFPIRVATMIHYFDMDAVAIGPLMGSAISVVHHQKWNVCPKSTGPNGLDDGLEITSIARGHHSDP